MGDLNRALAAYRDAVAKRAFWEHHGTRRDGNLENAKAVEKVALRDLKRTIKEMSN